MSCVPYHIRKITRRLPKPVLRELAGGNEGRIILIELVHGKQYEARVAFLNLSLLALSG